LRAHKREAARIGFPKGGSRAMTSTQVMVESQGGGATAGSRPSTHTRRLRRCAGPLASTCAS
jgi:hypothetical protein